MTHEYIDYRVNYRVWLVSFINDMKLFYNEHYNHIDIDSLDRKIFEVLVQLYKDLGAFKNSYVCLDLNEIKHPVCILKVIKQESKESLIVTCPMSNSLRKLNLYRFPNLTPCPRCEAFKHVLEDYLREHERSNSFATLLYNSPDER